MQRFRDIPEFSKLLLREAYDRNDPTPQAEYFKGTGRFVEEFAKNSPEIRGILDRIIKGVSSSVGKLDIASPGQKPKGAEKFAAPPPETGTGVLGSRLALLQNGNVVFFSDQLVDADEKELKGVHEITTIFPNAKQAVLAFYTWGTEVGITWETPEQAILDKVGTDKQWRDLDIRSGGKYSAPPAGSSAASARSASNPVSMDCPNCGSLIDATENPQNRNLLDFYCANCHSKYELKPTTAGQTRP